MAHEIFRVLPYNKNTRRNPSISMRKCLTHDSGGGSDPRGVISGVEKGVETKMYAFITRPNPWETDVCPRACAIEPCRELLRSSGFCCRCWIKLWPDGVRSQLSWVMMVGARTQQIERIGLFSEKETYYSNFIKTYDSLYWYHQRWVLNHQLINNVYKLYEKNIGHFFLP